jgi:hypothetical protein
MSVDDFSLLDILRTDPTVEFMPLVPFVDNGISVVAMTATLEPASVPEPGSLAILAVGLLGTMFLGSQRQLRT